VIPGYVIHGHAIVSDDDRIADAGGSIPPGLRNAADWKRFQAALDRAAVTVLGRHGHYANPNPKRRNRMVVSSTARAVERRVDGWWWNPAETDFAQAVKTSAPSGGIVAVTGGRSVFDLFLGIGFDEFHLARAGGVLIPGGIALFSTVRSDRSAEAVLSDAGLVPDRRETLDVSATVSITVWRRAKAA
jgi:hypothetical protein